MTPHPVLPCRNHGSHFEKHKAAFEEGAARDDAVIEDEEGREGGEGSSRSPDGEKGSRPTSVGEDELRGGEKGSVHHV